jgi:phage FluMu gp28-like protein
MADVASTPAQDGADKTRPQKPDEAKYKEDLAKAEKEHEAAQARFVCSPASTCAHS